MRPVAIHDCAIVETPALPSTESRAVGLFHSRMDELWINGPIATREAEAAAETIIDTLIGYDEDADFGDEYVVGYMNEYDRLFAAMMHEYYATYAD